MKFAIGTPVHSNNDKKVKKWLKNLAKLKYPANLILVDTSPDFKYSEKLKKYCKQYKIKKYEIKHLEINQANGIDEMIGRSREAIRQHVLKNDYDAWLSLEIKNSISENTLSILSDALQIGKIDIICILDRENFSEKPLSDPNADLSCALISKNALKKRGFLLEFPDMPNNWYQEEKWFKKLVIKNGGKYVEIAIDNVSLPSIYKNKKTLKLNLGCGDKHKTGYINIDVLEPCDLKLDITKPLPFPNNSVDEVFSEGNTICLFSKKQWRSVKKEMVRVLKVGGKLELLFLNFEYILKAFLENKDDKRWTYWWRTIFSAQKDEFDYSKNAFTCDKLVSDLTEEGMVGFKKLKSPIPEYVHLVCYKYKK